MRNTLLLLSAFSAVLFSCTPISYYQVCKVTPTQAPAETSDQHIEFEDSVCRVAYNLWRDGGNAGFALHNKTDKDIYIHLDRSFFVRNGFATPYYRGRTYVSSAGNTVSNAKSFSWGQSQAKPNLSNVASRARVTTDGISFINGTTSHTQEAVSYAEPRVVCVPSHTTRVFEEFIVSGDIFRDCDLLRYPAAKTNTTPFKFEEHNSPIVFSNRIAYGFDGESSSVMDNTFYVSEITNYADNAFTEKKPISFCGETLPTSQSPLSSGSVEMGTNFIYSSPSAYYIKYEKGNAPSDKFKH